MGTCGEVGIEVNKENEAPCKSDPERHISLDFYNFALIISLDFFRF